MDYAKMITLERAYVEAAKSIAIGFDVYQNSASRKSNSYVFTYIPKQRASERALKAVKAILKGTEFRVKLQGRAGRSGTKYRGMVGNASFVPLSDATRMDVYIYSK